ncbi:MAG: hypothetical protein ACODAA_00060 [Gemmatimonadota bacterium]
MSVSTVRPPSRALASLFVLLLASSLAGCGDAGDAGGADSGNEQTEGTAAETGSSGDVDVLGTIEAEVDGEARTWYVVEGSVRGEPYASGMFMPGGGSRLVTLGGFDTDDPPLDSFQTDAAAGDISLGDYEGSAINISVDIPDDQASLEVELSGMSGTSAIAYMPVATTEDVMSSALFAQSGSIRIEDAEFDEARGSLRGTFSGELSLVDGSRTATISNGRFSVEDIPTR